MKTNGLIGRRIVAIRQHRFFNDYTGRMDSRVDALILDNGIELRTFGLLTENEVHGDLVRTKRMHKAVKS